MKGNDFGDRARCLAEWFQDWNSCEQIIALYSLLSKVSATQARFLSFVLDHSLKNGCDSQELSKLEMQANSSVFLKSLHSQTEEEALAQLLSHLPLLNPGNSEARAEYMNLLPKVLLGSSEENDYHDLCRQLLSLALLHPAFPHEDREALTYWLSQLDSKHKSMAAEVHTVAPSSSSASPSLFSSSQQQTAAQQPPALPPRIRQVHPTEDVTPPSNSRIYIDVEQSHSSIPSHPHPHHPDQLPSSDPYSADDEEVQKTLASTTCISSSKTFLPGQAHISPMHLSYEDGGGGGGGSVIREKANTVPRVNCGGGSGAALMEEVGVLISMNKDPGMKDVPLWLKSLRLHKYQSLFSGFTYEQMLHMNEDYLEDMNVTKGARTKLTLSIRKLARRPETLLEIEQDIGKHGHMLQCFNELRLMLQTPIKPFSPTFSQNRKNTSSYGLAGKPHANNTNTGVRTGLCVGSGDEEERVSSPHLHSSSDAGSDLEELLTKDFPQEDLPSLITRAIGKGFNQLMLHTDTNEDNLTAFLKLLDNALQHEVFNLDQKKLFFDWKQQCNQILRVLSSKKNARGCRQYELSVAYTMPATPRCSVGAGYSSGGTGMVRNRSLRGNVIRNGDGVGVKGLSLPGSTATRTSSTLPRMSARQLQLPIPHATPSFLRPTSAFIPSAAPPIPSHTHLHGLSHQVQVFQSPHTSAVTQLSSPATATTASTPFLGSSGVPPPLPPRTYEMSETYMDDLCKSITDHVLPDDLSDN